MAEEIHSKRGTIHSKIRLKVLERNGFLKVKERLYLHWMEFSTHFRNPGVDLKCVENSIVVQSVLKSSEIGSVLLFSDGFYCEWYPSSCEFPQPCFVTPFCILLYLANSSCCYYSSPRPVTRRQGRTHHASCSPRLRFWPTKPRRVTLSRVRLCAQSFW